MKRLKNQEENTQKMWHIKAHKGWKKYRMKVKKKGTGDKIGQLTPPCH